MVSQPQGPRGWARTRSHTPHSHCSLAGWPRASQLPSRCLCPLCHGGGAAEFRDVRDEMKRARTRQGSRRAQGARSPSAPFPPCSAQPPANGAPRGAGGRLCPQHPAQGQAPELGDPSTMEFFPPQLQGTLAVAAHSRIPLGNCLGPGSSPFRGHANPKDWSSQGRPGPAASLSSGQLPRPPQLRLAARLAEHLLPSQVSILRALLEKPPAPGSCREQLLLGA